MSVKNISMTELSLQVFGLPISKQFLTKTWRWKKFILLWSCQKTLHPCAKNFTELMECNTQRGEIIRSAHKPKYVLWQQQCVAVQMSNLQANRLARFDDSMV